MYVPDLLHEFELGVWKATFIHLMCILYANGGDSIQELNDRYALLSGNETSVLKIGRYRKVPTFGHGTIQHFASNASGMKKLAAHDYEDLLQVRMFHLAMLISLKCCDQCAIPVFEVLCPRCTTGSSWTSFLSLLRGMRLPNFGFTRKQL
jgi:hypothetical protein